jgi:hypothetical protein
LGIVGSVKEGHEVERRGEEDIRDYGGENAEWGLRPEGVRQKGVVKGLWSLVGVFIEKSWWTSRSSEASCVKVESSRVVGKP